MYSPYAAPGNAARLNWCPTMETDSYVCVTVMTPRRASDTKPWN